MAVQTQTVINRQDPEIEAYRLGLLGDTQGLVQDQIFGQNVQNLRDQGLDDEAIAERLGRDVADVGRNLATETILTQRKSFELWKLKNSRWDGA